MFSGMYTGLGTGDILVRMFGSWEKIMVDQRRSRRFFKQVNHSVLLTVLSYDLHACGNILMHIDMFRGMYTSLGTGDILVRMCGSWEKIMVDQRRSRRFFKQVIHSVLLTDLSHDLHACGNVLMYINMFSELYTSLGKGDILVRMCVSWEKIMVDQRRSRCFFKEVNHSVLLTDLSHDLHACGNILMHTDMFSGMYTSLGIGDILVRMCVSWEKIMVDQRRSRRFYKQVNHSVLLTDHSHSHDLHACGNVLMHIDMFRGLQTSLGSGEILVRMSGSWEKIMVEQRRWRRFFKQLNHSLLLTDHSHDHAEMFSCVKVGRKSW